MKERYIMKKILSIFVLSVMIFCANFTGTAHAISVDNLSNSTIDNTQISIDRLKGLPIGTIATRTVSEYDMLKELQQKTDAQLKKDGYSLTDISAIRQPLKAKSKYGNVTYTISYTEMYQKKGITYLTTKMTWNWSTRPVCVLTDIAAMTNSEKFVKVSASAVVQYYSYGNKKSKSYQVKPTVNTKDSGTGTYIKIAMGKDYDRIAKDYKNIALSGSMTVKWSISGKYKQTGISSNYGHTIITCTPSVSFGSKSGSISFTPVKKCKCGTEAYAIAKLK